MLQTIAISLAGIGALLGIGGTVFKSSRTVPTGHGGIVFRFQAPHYHWGYDADGNRTWTIYAYEGHPLWWMIPLIHRRDTTPRFECNTDDITIAVQRTDDFVKLTRIILVYRLDEPGLYWVLCRAPNNAPLLISSYFHDLVGDVLASCSANHTRDEIRQEILSKAADNANLQKCGVIPEAVSMSEYSDAPMSQIARLIAKIVAGGGKVLTYGAQLNAVLAQAEEALHQDGGHGTGN